MSGGSFGTVLARFVGLAQSSVRTKRRRAFSAHAFSARATSLVLALGLVPALAHAHPTGFALLTVDVADGGEVDATFRVSGAPERALGVELVFPEGCEERLPTTTRISPTGADRHYRLRCAMPVRGELELRGLPVDLQARVEIRGALRTSALVDAGRPRVDFATPARDGVFARYVGIGVEHIAFGIDHVLFVLALVLLVRTPRRALTTVSAFTLGHSLTLALASLGWVAVPTAPVEACIALSVLLVARETLATTGTVRAHPELSAGLFGLLHGLGFASALSAVGLPDDALVLALFAFNLGVELGQVALVLVGLAALGLVERRTSRARRERWVETPIAYALGTVAAFWAIERVVAVVTGS